MVECSSGTYIRALARDLGAALGVGGHLTALRRTRVGPYDLAQARTLEQLAEELLVLPIGRGRRRAAFPRCDVTAEEAGVSATADGCPQRPRRGPIARALGPDGELLALVEEHGPWPGPSPSSR